MPEGDTIYQAARRVGDALVGSLLERVEGSHPSVRAESSRLVGATVTSVRNYGKQHMVDTDAGYTIRTHMGMPGVWHVYPSGGKWRKPPGAARVVLATSASEAVCFSAPTVEVDRTSLIDHALTGWGPDLTADEFDADRAVALLLPQPPSRTVADVLLDQRVVAGVGNVFKNEILFLQRLHPSTPIGSVDAPAGRALVDRARQLLYLNRDRPNRVTTGETRQGASLWVYGRDGQPCRRCRSPIDGAWLGDFERITYWCPTCQPLPAR